MLRKKVLGIGTNSATLLVQDTEANNALRVLRRVNVGDLSDEAVKSTQRFYDKILKASPSMPAIVEVHTVLLQNSFLNIITSYGAGGDVATFLDDDLSGPLPEKTALQWLLIMAHAVKQLRENTGLPFYGLSLDRVYLAEKASGDDGAALPETVLVGLPLPADTYRKIMSDRIQQGLALEREYPPEVLANKNAAVSNTGGSVAGYDPSLSDVWVLGSMGARLLASNTSLASRSSRANELIGHMSATVLRERYSLDQVIKSLASIVGAVRLPARTKPSSASSGSGKGKPTQVASEAPALQRPPSRHRTTPQQRVQTPTRDAHDRRPPEWQQQAQEQFDKLKRMNSGTQASPLRRTNSRGLGEASPTRQQVSSKPAGGSGRSASAQKMQRSGSSNSALRSSTEKGLGAGSPQDAPSSRSATPNNAKIRDLLADQQESLRLRRERLRQEREQQRKQRGAGNTSQSADSLDLAGSVDPDGDGESKDGGQENIRRHLQDWRSKKTQEFAAAGEQERDGVLVFTPPQASAELEDGNKRAKARKNASPAVRRQAGSPRGSGDQTPTPRTSTPDAHAFANLKGNQAPIHYTRQKEVPITIAVPKGFDEEVTNDGGRAGRGGVASPPGARRRPGRPEWVTAGKSDSASSHTPSEATPKRDVPRPAARAADASAGDDAPHVAGATPPREPPSRSADLAGAARPQVPLTRGHADPAPASGGAESGAGQQPMPNMAPRRSLSSDRATQTALQCAVDALRTSIRNLCRDRAVYGEAMVITSEFARQTEPIRTAPRANEEFMRRLKEGLADNRLFAAAAPLCAQLVALEGLEQSIFEAQRAQRRGGR